MKSTTFKFLWFFVWAAVLFVHTSIWLPFALWVLPYSVPLFMGLLVLCGYLMPYIESLLKMWRYNVYKWIRPHAIEDGNYAWRIGPYLVLKTKEGKYEVCWKGEYVSFVFENGGFTKWGVWTPSIKLLYDKAHTIILYRGELKIIIQFEFVIWLGIMFHPISGIIRLPFIMIAYTKDTIHENNS